MTSALPSPTTESLLTAVRAAASSIAPAERKLAIYVSSYADVVVYQSILEVAEGAGVGYGTVVRFCQRFGAAGFHDFKMRLTRDLARAESRDGEVAGDDEDVAAACTAIRDTATRVPTRVIDRAARLIVAAPQVLVLGAGGSAPTARDLEYGLRRLGRSASAIEDGHVMAMAAATVPRGSVLLAASFTGANKDVLRAAELARARRVRIIALTNSPRSPLATHADIVLATVLRVSGIASELASKVATQFVIDRLLTRLLVLDPHAQAALEASYQAVAKRVL